MTQISKTDDGRAATRAPRRFIGFLICVLCVICGFFFLLSTTTPAAPVPRDTRPSFGDNGLLARADLEKVRFDSRLIKTDDADGKRAQDGEDEAVEKNPEEKVKEEKAEEPAWAKSPNRFDVAVHMPWARFREGESIPVYFVLRNNRNSRLGLRSCIDFSGPNPQLHGSAASFDVRDRATGKTVVRMLSVTTNCGGGSL